MPKYNKVEKKNLLTNMSILSVSILCMFGIWKKQCNYSHTAISDCTDHKAPAIMTSMRLVLNDLVDKGIKKVNVVSDSPTSQYRNRRMVWILHCCCKEKMIDLNGFI